MNPEAYKQIPAIREALKNENYALADKLNKKIQGTFSQSYAPLGTMNIHFQHKGTVTNYHRELDLTKAVSTVTYKVDGVNYKREYFVSYPDQIMVIRISADKKASVSFQVNFDSQLRYKSTVANKVLQVNGYVPFNCLPSYSHGDKDPIQFDEKRGTRFTSLFKIKNAGGKTIQNDSTIAVSNANEAIIYVSIATSFNGFDKNPATEGKPYKTLTENQLENAYAKSFDQLLQSSVNLIFRCAFFAYGFIAFPIDNWSVHPAIIVTFTRVIQIAVIICIACLIPIKQHGNTSDKHTHGLHQDYFVNRCLNRRLIIFFNRRLQSA
jgi:alpha-L-fucosidase 2